MRISSGVNSLGYKIFIVLKKTHKNMIFFNTIKIVVVALSEI